MANALVLSLPGLVRSRSSATLREEYQQIPTQTGKIHGSRLIHKTVTSTVVDKNAQKMEYLLNEVVRQIESRLGSQAVTPFLDIEQDVWAAMPAKSEFETNAIIEFEGRAKPNFFVDWIEED